MTALPSPSSYSDIFLTMVLNGLGYAIENVRGKTVLEDETRKHALNMASLGLQHPHAWRCTRDLLLLLAPLMERAGWREDWIDFLAEVVKYALQQEDKEAIGEFHFHLGLLFKLLGDYPKAVFHYQQSRSAFATLKDSERQARTLNHWAYAALTTTVQIDVATELVEQAEALGTSFEVRGYSCTVRGVIATRRQDFESAYPWYAKALEYWKSTQNNRSLAWGYNNLGTALNRLGKKYEAIDAFNHALYYFDLAQDPAYRAIAEHNLGIIHYYLDQPAEALNYYVSALPIIRQSNRGAPLASLYNGMGKAYLALQQFEEAYQSYDLAREIYWQIEDVGEAVNVMSNLGEWFELRGDLEGARDILEQAVALLDANPEIPSYESYREVAVADLERIKGLKG